jgi:hypothetical protein
MRAGHRDLLTALLDACRRGLVTHEDAAKLVGIRKSELGDLVAWRMVEAAAWRTFQAAFHHAFPECNVNLWRLPSVDRRIDVMWRDQIASWCRHHTAHEAEWLPASQPQLFAPLSNAARDFSEPEKRDAWENMDGSDDRSPAHLSRALPRVVGQLPGYDRAA